MPLLKHYLRSEKEMIVDCFNLFLSDFNFRLGDGDIFINPSATEDI